MKTTLALAGIALALCSLAPAQDNPQRVVVPARNSARPRKLTVHSLNGSITVKTHAAREVIVEAVGSERRSRREEAPAGMRRIDIPSTGLSVEEEDNQITVRLSPPGGSGLVITVPADTSLDLHTNSGPISVDGVKGEIAVDTLNGPTTLTGVSGSVLAHSLNGPIKVSMNAVDATKPLSFSTLNGTIDVTLPADYKGNVKLSTGHGAIYSDFDFRLGGGTITQSNDTSEGRFRVRIDRDRTLSGTINGGGPEATFKTYNGTIYIRKKQ